MHGDTIAARCNISAGCAHGWVFPAAACLIFCLDAAVGKTRGGKGLFAATRLGGIRIFGSGEAAGFQRLGIKGAAIACACRSKAAGPEFGLFLGGGKLAFVIALQFDRIGQIAFRRGPGQASMRAGQRFAAGIAAQEGALGARLAAEAIKTVCADGADEMQAWRPSS